MGHWGRTGSLVAGCKMKQPPCALRLYQRLVEVNSAYFPCINARWSTASIIICAHCEAMSLSPRPASAPSGDSRGRDSTSSRDTSYFQTAEQRSAIRGEPSASHKIPISVTPTPPSDGHRTTAQGTPSDVIQSEEQTNGLLGNAATFHAASDTAESDPWTRKTLLTRGVFASNF